MEILNSIDSSFFNLIFGSSFFTGAGPLQQQHDRRPSGVRNPNAEPPPPPPRRKLLQRHHTGGVRPVSHPRVLSPLRKHLNRHRSARTRKHLDPPTTLHRVLQHILRWPTAGDREPIEAHPVRRCQLRTLRQGSAGDFQAPEPGHVVPPSEHVFGSVNCRAGILKELEIHGSFEQHVHR